MKNARSLKADATMTLPHRGTGMTLIPGVHRSDVPYVWPPLLFRPSFEQKIVYLDMNHWIYLAQAAIGHRSGARHEPALAAVRRAKASGRFTFVLSSAHHMEMEGIANPRQRRHVADVMEELTEFRALLSRAVIMRLEVEAALDELAAPRAAPLYPPLTLIGNGIFHALGLRGGLRIRSADGTDITDSARLEWPDGPEAFDLWQANAELLLERSVLRGPTDEEAPSLRAQGWRPEVTRQVAEDRAAEEQAQAERFTIEEGRWRRGRTRDVVAGRHMAFELNEMIAEGLAARGCELMEVFDEVTKSRRFTDSMPSSDVAITLLTARHRNAHTQWVTNDIFDIDALSVAVPYCDIVVTEQHACHVLRGAHADQRANTRLFTTLGELAELIDA
jgi:hypothetical protein